MACPRDWCSEYLGRKGFIQALQRTANALSVHQEGDIILLVEDGTTNYFAKLRQLSLHIGLDYTKRNCLCWSAAVLLSPEVRWESQQLKDIFSSLLCLHHLGAVCQGWRERLWVPQEQSSFLFLALFVHIFLRQHLVLWGHGLSQGFVGALLYNMNIVKATNKVVCFLPSPFPVSCVLCMGMAALFWMFL